MSLKFQVDGKAAGDTLKRNLANVQGRLSNAAKATITEAERRILAAGKADMAAGGNFGSARWQRGLHTRVTQTGPQSFILTVLHRVPFWRIFEFGGRIKGRPLLWIPLPWANTKVRARDYPRPLFRVDRAGKNPLLMTSTGKGKATAVYVGVKSVFLKRRFHLRRVIRNVSRQMPALFRKAQRLKGNE